MGVIVFFTLQGDVTNKIERCLKLRPFSSDVGFPRTRSKNVTVLSNHCRKVNTIPRWMIVRMKGSQLRQLSAFVELVDIENLFAQVINSHCFRDRLSNNFSCIKSFVYGLNTSFRRLNSTTSSPWCPHLGPSAWQRPWPLRRFFRLPFCDVLKCHYDENCILSIEAILKHKQVACMRRKMLFTFFKYLSLFQRYSSF